MKNKLNSMSLAALSALLLFSLPLVAHAQTTLINGANQTGTIFTNTTDSYIFTANKGDSINLRLGTSGFPGILQLYGPDSLLLGTVNDSTDDLIAYTATNSGTFIVQVSSDNLSGHPRTGPYVLNLSQIPEAFIVPDGDGGGPLINGANATGTITLGRQDLWTFTANAGDSINLRLGTTGFNGRLELYGPDGAFLQYYQDSTDDLIAYTATNSGTFTVLVSSYDLNGNDTGTYVLNLSQIPEPFIVPAGYGGGPLTNGANAAGTITLGRQDLWTFTANKGDSINLRLGTTGFLGNLVLYGPNGALLAAFNESVDGSIAYTATNSGTFTVLVDSYDLNGNDTGTYVLNLSQIPEPFIVPAGYGGGPLTNGANA
ncbi:MAG TPA: PPC domain-containing protein, partial [Verrucomicrobiae bacterium]|nr:PPC domain-containing protein [Verrucomicrobiae bacterium]